MMAKYYFIVDHRNAFVFEEDELPLAMAIIHKQKNGLSFVNNSYYLVVMLNRASGMNHCYLLFVRKMSKKDFNCRYG